MDYGVAVFDPTTNDVIWESQRIPGRTFHFRCRKKKTKYYTCRACGLEKNNENMPVPSFTLKFVNNEQHIISKNDPDEGHFCPDQQQQQTRDAAKRGATKKRKESADQMYVLLAD